MNNHEVKYEVGVNRQSYYKDFVGHYPRALSPEVCETMIVMFDRYREFHESPASVESQMDFARDRKGQTNYNHKIDDTARGFDEFVFGHADGTLYSDVSVGEHGFSTVVNKCVVDYVNNYGPLLEAHDMVPFKNLNYKVQKSKIGQGYNVFHTENIGGEFSTRVLAWLVYLNDVEEGGETEFLYYNKRVVPQQGTVIVWPAGFTHTHRGNPPISNTKYVLTGWVTRHNPN